MCSFTVEGCYRTRTHVYICMQVLFVIDGVQKFFADSLKEERMHAEIEKGETGQKGFIEDCFWLTADILLFGCF